MRILVMLKPTNKRGTKTAYTKLRNFLISDGYQLLGPELFLRVATNRKGAEKHLRRLAAYDPGTGCVRVLKLTEKQFSNIWYLTGEPDKKKKTIGANGLIML